MRLTGWLAAPALAALLAGAGVWGWTLWQGPQAQRLPPRDVALAPRDLPDPLRIAILGTSLSHDEPWTAALSRALTACLGPTEITVIARPGAGVLWGQRQVGAVAQAGPDLVLLEFAINDADLRDGLGRARADAETRRLIADLRAALPDAAVVELTMSPARGMRAVLRPGLARRYGDVIARAGAGAMAHPARGAIDLYTRWLALPRGQRGLTDGLHPEPGISESVTVTPVRDYIAASYSAACSESDSS